MINHFVFVRKQNIPLLPKTAHFSNNGNAVVVFVVPIQDFNNSKWTISLRSHQTHDKTFLQGWGWSGLKMVIVWNDFGCQRGSNFWSLVTILDRNGSACNPVQTIRRRSLLATVSQCGTRILWSVYTLSISRVGVFVQLTRWTQGFLIIPVHLTLDQTPLEILKRRHQI